MKKAKIIFIIISMMVLSGCEGGSGPSAQSIEENIHKGTSGMVAVFIENMPPARVFEDDVFPIGIEIRNKGAFDIVNGNLILNIFDEHFELEKGNIDESINLEGKSIGNPEGGLDRLNYLLKSRVLDLNDEAEDSTITAQFCYEYQTQFGGEVCVDTDYYNMNKEKKIESACSAEDISLSGGQGGPVAVTNVKVSMIGSTDIITPKFEIYVRNTKGDTGKGKIVGAGKAKALCSGNLGEDGFNYVDYEVYLSEEILDCTPERFKIDDDENVIKCTLERGVSKEVQPYTSILSVILDYGYSERITKRVKIKKDI